MQEATPVAATPLARSERFIILFCVFFGGAILMGIEILGFRIIGKTFGSALRETSVVISVFMGAMSVGYFTGGRIADRFPRMETFTTALVLAALSALPIPLLDTLIADRVFESSMPLGVHSTVVSIVLFFLPTMCLASLSPIAIRLLTSGIERTGKVAGTTSAISTVGSIVGSVATAFVLIDFFRSTERTVVVLSLCALLLATLTLFVSSAAAPGRRLGFVVSRGSVAVVLLLAIVTLASRQGPLFRQPPPAGSVVLFEQDSAFHHIVVEEKDRVRVLRFDQAHQTSMSVDDEYEGGFELTDFFHVPMALRPDAERVLFLGLGGGTGPKRFLRDYPNAIIEAVDVDAVVIDVARDYFGLPVSPRLTVVHEDARAYLKRSHVLYDAVVIDVYTTNRYGSAIPTHVTTVEFFEEVRKRLAPGGMVVFNCAARHDHPLTQAIAQTLRRVFPFNATFKMTRSANTVLFASTAPLPRSEEAMVRAVEEAIESGRIRMPRLADRAAQLIQYQIPPTVMHLTDDFAPVDTLSLSADRAAEELPRQ